MSVRVEADRVYLEGDCLVEDAELLLRAVQENPTRSIDIGDCGRLHMAVMQVLLAAERRTHGRPANDFAREWLLPQLLSAAD